MHDLPARRAESAQQGDDPVRASIIEAMLVAGRRAGLPRGRRPDVLERYGGHRVQFWQHFASKEDCFAIAYATWADRLARRPARRRRRSRATGGGECARPWSPLFDFVDERAAMAQGPADRGGDRRRRGARQARGDDPAALGRSSTPPAGRPIPTRRPPPLTGVFVAGGIATYVERTAGGGQAGAIWEGLPELMRFATGPYFGEQAAEAEFEAGRAFLAATREARSRVERVDLALTEWRLPAGHHDLPPTWSRRASAGAWQRRRPTRSPSAATAGIAVTASSPGPASPPPLLQALRRPLGLPARRLRGRRHSPLRADRERLRRGGRRRRGRAASRRSRARWRCSPPSPPSFTC